MTGQALQPAALLQGKPRSLMQVQPLAEVHPFAPTLREWEQGIKVDCGEDWDWSVVEEAVARGPHPSAQTDESYELFRDDIAYQEQAGFCKVYTWSELQAKRPSNLKVSPVAVVPQEGRRGRIILDLSFPVTRMVDGKPTVVQASVNESTRIQAPQEPVKEIGKVFDRLCGFMKAVPPGKHILFSKEDISDGFWRLVVSEEDCFNFAYVLPQPPGEPLRIVVPAALQMGWVESPGYFCCATETIRDLINYHVDNNTALPEDPIEQELDVPNVPRRACEDDPSKLLQVYVDDFCNAATQSTDGTHLPTINRAIVHSIHSVLPPPAVTGHQNGKQPISQKKLAKGEGDWRTEKEMIGFEWEGRKRTVCLPTKKSKQYVADTKAMLYKKRRAPVKRFQTVVGKLRHAARVMPAAKAFFTPLNHALRGSPKHVGLGKSSEVRHCLDDLCSLLRMLQRRPTHVDEIVPDAPKFVGYHDAAAEGAGGVWFSLDKPMSPIVWRFEFPPDIKVEVVSDSNPNGKLTNSDLELAAEVMAVGVLITEVPSVKRMTIGTLCDNTPTVSWIENMASKASTPAAGRLLRGLAIMMLGAQMGPLITTHVAGDDNIMADIASRPTKAKQYFRAQSDYITDLAFLKHFSTAFPLPHQAAWRLAVPAPDLVSNICETLRGKRLEMPQWMGMRGHGTGMNGPSSAPSTTSVATSTVCPRVSATTRSLPLLSSSGEVTSAKAVKLEFSQLKRLLGMSPKSLFWTGALTRGEQPSPSGTSTCPSGDY